MNYNNIGKFIQQKRKEKKLTQKELAEKLNITDKAVSKWERGLGCPDVSILELLAQELEVSILEILKGRTIENEVIKVTEANDYIENTIEYTKKNIKETLNRIITFIIISIALLLLILNIENIISMNKTYKYNFDKSNQKQIKININKIEENTNIILKNKGKYNDKDYKEICRQLKDNLETIKNIELINETGEKNYSKNEIYLLNLKQINNTSIIELAKIMEKYNNDKTYTEALIDNTYTGMLLNSNIDNTYKYKIFDLSKENDTRIDNNPLYKKMIKLKTSISTYLNLLEKIKEVGEISE